VAISARPANDLPEPANVRSIDLRSAPTVRAGTFFWEGHDVVTGWHRHPYHQVEYALRGEAEGETPTGHYLVPPQQAIWIPAGLPHLTTLFDVTSVSVFFEPSMLPGPDDRARVLAAAPVIREMIAYGVRWPIERPESDVTADAYFDVLARLVLDWLDEEAPLWLPTTADPVIADVIAFTDTHLASATASDVCRAVGLSERTLRRRFVAATGMTWRTYLLQSRLLRAMTLLADGTGGPGGSRTILDVATAVGFDSPSAFTRAFQGLTGERPSAYRARVSRSSSP